jgi:hypothetical protein
VSECALVRPEQRLVLLSRFPSSESIVRTARPLIEGARPLARRARSLAGQPTRLKVGAAAATLATVAGVAAGAVGAEPAEAAVRTLGPVSTTSALSHTAVSPTKVPGQVLAGPILSGPAAADVPAQQASPLNQPAAQPSAGSAGPSTSSTPVAATQQTPISTPSTSTSGSSQQSSSQAQSVQQHVFHTPQQPYVFYDSVTPGQIPTGNIVATYADGPYAVSPSQVSGAKWVLWIDVNGSDPTNAQVLDVEPGDATPTSAATWAQERLTAHPNGYAVIYTMLSEWPAVQAAIHTLPSSMQSHVRYWIADPTGVPHVVPGASATQWDWGQKFDVSTALPSL